MDTLVAITNSEGVRLSRAVDNADIIKEAGFEIVDTAETTLTKEQCKKFLDAKQTKKFTSGPCVAMLIRQADGFNKFAKLAGEFEYLYASADEVESARARRAVFPSTPVLQRVLLVVTSSASVDAEKLVSDNDFMILEDTKSKLTSEQANKLFPDQKGADSGESRILALERMDAVDVIRIAVGREAGVYASPSAETGVSDIESYFPVPFSSTERTLAMIKPNASSEAATIVPIIEANGFKVIAQDTVTLSKARAGEFYAEHKGKPFYGALTAFMSSGPIVALVLQKPNAIASWRSLIGPTSNAKSLKPDSLRARWGIDTTRNGFHGSDSKASAERETNFFFPGLLAYRLPKAEEYVSKPIKSSTKATNLKAVLAKGLTALCRVKPVGLDAIEWLGKWLIQNNPSRPVVEAPAAEVVSVAEVTEDGNDNAIMSLAGRVKKTNTRIVVALGPEGSRDGAVCKLVAQSRDFEHIDVEKLLVAAATNGPPQFAKPLAEAVNAGRSAPSSILQHLVEKAIIAFLDTNPAMRGETPPTILLSGFPQNLDQALLFAKQVGEPNVFLSFEGNAEDFSSRVEVDLKEEKRGAVGTGKAASDRRIRRFKDETQAVIDHYRKWSKVSTLKDTGAVKDVARNVSEFLP